MPFKALNKKDLTLLTNRRSQSALEYMMTYGWAILIIVIVAVILYSMGIFNPSSSITFTSSGFSPFTVSSSLCNNIGYKIAVLAGPIPNNANSLTMNNGYLLNYRQHLVLVLLLTDRFSMLLDLLMYSWLLLC